MIKISIGTPTKGYCERILGLLLESTAINVPVAVVAVVSIATYNTVGDVLMSVVVPGQSFASVLVMYQIALGKATCERLEKRNSEEV